MMTLTIATGSNEMSQDAPQESLTTSQETSQEKSKTSQESPKTSQETDAQSQKTSQKIIELIKSEKYITTQKMADILGIDRRNIARNIKKLQEQGVLERIGATKNGYWEIK